MLTLGLSAQFTWPEDPAAKSEAQTLWTIFDDSYKQGDFEAAKEPLQTLLDKFPSLSKSLYINGIKVWKESFKNEKDAAKKSDAAEKVMDLYQMRYDNFAGEEAKVIDRQANDAFQFFYKDKAKTRYILDLFDKAYELKGNRAVYSLGRYNMNMAAIAYSRNIGISDEEILNIYDRCTNHIDYYIAKAKEENKSTKRYDQIKEFVDKKLADLRLIDCDFIVNKLVPEFEANPTDAELANKIFVFAFDGGCTDEAWFTAAAEVVFDSNPNYGVGYMLGTKYGAEKEYDKSKEYFIKSVELTDDNTDKAKALKQIANTYRIQKNKGEARKYAMQAAEIDPSLKESMYSLIGDMIMSSSECDKKVSQVDDRARFIAAYDYYAMAGNGSKMNAAKAQFPTIGDIFTANKEEGESIKVGCWIQKTVKLQKRPQ
jgi:tetratricopeptide (TPR) repeat protein